MANHSYPIISIRKAARGYLIASAILPFLWAGMVLCGMSQETSTWILAGIILIAGIFHLLYLIQQASKS
jgi:hypothetical protein